MNPVRRLPFLLHITYSQGIARRYFVTNGFDGALTMLGLCLGFRISQTTDIDVAISACAGAGIALGMSGLSSAYISEVAERKKALAELEQAMITDLSSSAHGEAARIVPFMIAAVNGLAPLIICLLIISPLWLAQAGASLPAGPLEIAIGVAFAIITLLGVFLARVSQTPIVPTAFRTVLITVITASLILLLA